MVADKDIASHDGDLNGFVISPAGRAVLLGETDTTDRPLFVNSVAEGAIPMLLGRPCYSRKAAYQAGSPNVVGFAGDWTQAMYGIVQGMEVTVSDQATLTVGSGDDVQSINLWQQNMFAVRAEIEVGFRADTACFNKLTATA